MNKLLLKIAISKLAQDPGSITVTYPYGSPLNTGNTRPMNLIPGRDINVRPTAFNKPLSTLRLPPQPFIGGSQQATTPIQPLQQPQAPTPPRTEPTQRLRPDYSVSLSPLPAGKNIFEEQKKQQEAKSTYLEYLPETQEHPRVAAHEVIPELRDFHRKLVYEQDPEVFGKFQQKFEKYRNAAPFFQDLTKPENIQKLKDIDPELYTAAQWLKGVHSRTIDPYADPRTAQANLQKLWEFGAFNYATKGFTYDVNDPYGRDIVVQRYMDVFNKAMGDKRLDLDDLNYVYNNFSSTLNLDPTHPVTQHTFAEWWSSDNVNPLFKAGMLLGVPLLAIGLISGIFRGFDTGSVLMTLLGLTGLGAGMYGYMSYKPQSQTEPPLSTGVSDILSQYGIQQPAASIAAAPTAADTTQTGTNPTNLLGLFQVASSGNIGPEYQPVVAQTLDQFADVINEITSKPTTGSTMGDIASHIFGVRSGLGSLAIKRLQDLQEQLRLAATTIKNNPAATGLVASQLTEKRNEIMNQLQSMANKLGVDPNRFTAAIMQIPPEQLVAHIRKGNYATAEDALKAIADLGAQFEVKSFKF